MIKRKLIYYFLPLVLFFTTTLNVHSQVSTLPYYEYKIQNIKPDIYFAYRPDPLRVDVEGNVVVIINHKDVIVVDATGIVRSANQIIGEIKKLTDKPVRYLINTHFHYDHVAGNSSFVKAYPNLDIISSQYTYEQFSKQYFIDYFTNDSSRENSYKSTLNVLKVWAGDLRKESSPGNENIIAQINQWGDQDLPLIRNEDKKLDLTPPTLIIDHSITLNRDHQANVFLPGKGDTPGDTWVYLPKDKVLITGDAVVHPVPYGFSSQPLEWIETLKKMSMLDFDVLIPGHGDVQYGKEYLLKLIALLEEVKVKVEQSLDNGLTLDETKKAFNIDETEERFTHGDPIKKYFFFRYFKKPIVTVMYNDLKKIKGD